MAEQLAALGLEPSESAVVEPPRVAGCAGFIECRVQDRVSAGDHDLFVAQKLWRSRPTTSRSTDTGMSKWMPDVCSTTLAPTVTPDSPISIGLLLPNRRSRRRPPPQGFWSSA